MSWLTRVSAAAHSLALATEKKRRPPAPKSERPLIKNKKIGGALQSATGGDGRLASRLRLTLATKKKKTAAHSEERTAVY